MLEHVDRSCCEMDVCCQGFSKGKLADKAERFGAKVYLNPLSPDHLIFGIRLAKILKSGAYDILHVHVGAYSGFPVWIASISGVKSIVSIHSIQFPAYWAIFKIPFLAKFRSAYSRKSMDFACSHCDTLIGVSRSCIDELAPDLSVTATKTHVVHHGVKISNPKTVNERMDFRKSLHWPSESRIIITVGRFSPKKNHETVIQVFSEVLSSNPSARLVLVGDGLMRSEMEADVRRRSVDDYVAFMGHKEGAAEMMGNCDIMLMPSLHEGFGIVAIEAAAAGLPFVGSKVGGLAEVVHDGETGFLFDPLDIRGMALAVKKLLDDNELYSRLSSNARLRADRYFSVKDMVQKYLMLYRETLN